jgi:hypothetical protein
MSEVRWSPDVERAAFQLSRAGRRDLLRYADWLASFPYLGRVVGRGRYRNHRQVLLARRWWLLYQIKDGGPVVYLATIRDARRRPA